MQSPEWCTSAEPVPYYHAVAEMEARAAAIRDQDARELVWLLEHPALFTAGSSARPSDLLDPMGLPVIATGRGGQYTYHGPGQRIAYVMLDLKQRGGDVRGYVNDLENWLIKTLTAYGVRGERRDGRVGVWVERGDEEVKIAAIGVRIRRWVSYHGVSLNIAPNLEHYQGIVACGIREHSVTSLADLGIEATMDDVDAVLRETFDTIFG
ncbi:MAG: lipoyl(octanoyl) transferase LipB [Vicinamibacterales bacterium]|nr:lipoyl(octanoyl) transferase LipB [Vicinamibacterales bacterium]